MSEDKDKKENPEFNPDESYPSEVRRDLYQDPEGNEIEILWSGAQIPDSPQKLTRHQKYNLSPKDLERLEKENNFALSKHPRRIGRGLTRTVHDTSQKTGDIEKEIALKVPHDVKPEESIIGYINTRGEDVNIREAQMHNKLERHPRIVPVLGTMRTEDGRTVTWEPLKRNTHNLEDHIQAYGPINNVGRAGKFISQLLDPVNFLAEEGVLHRDFKPSNILMTLDGPFITDFQNAAYTHLVRTKALPTRGGAAYASPKINNNFIKGKETEHTEEDEVYSVAATILYALSGKNLGYKIREVRNPKIAGKTMVEDPRTGRVIMVDDNPFQIQLTMYNQGLEQITDRLHEANVKTAIRTMDGSLRRRWGRLLERALIPEHKRAIKSRHELKREVDKINSSTYHRARENLIQSLSFVLPTAVAVSLIGGMVALMRYNPPDRPPTMSDILRNADYTRFQLEDLTLPDKEFIYPVLVPYMQEAQKRTEKIWNEDIEQDIMHYAVFGKNVHRMDTRLVSAWLRACYLNRDLVEKYGKDKFGNTKRLDKSFVPREFFIVNDSLSASPRFTEGPIHAHGIMYLKLCLGPQRTVEETFVDYFTDGTAKKNAIGNTGSLTYLPRVEDHTLKPGFYSHIPLYQQDLISTALALYMITDDKGKVHYDWIPDIVQRGGLGTTPNAIVTKDIPNQKDLLEDLHEKRELKSIAPVKKQKK